MQERVQRTATERHSHLTTPTARTQWPPLFCAVCSCRELYQHRLKIPGHRPCGFESRLRHQVPPPESARYAVGPPENRLAPGWFSVCEGRSEARVKIAVSVCAGCGAEGPSAFDFVVCRKCENELVNSVQSGVNGAEYRSEPRYKVDGGYPVREGRSTPQRATTCAVCSEPLVTSKQEPSCSERCGNKFHNDSEAAVDEDRS